MWYIWPPEPKDEEHALGPPREGWSFGGGQEEQMFSNSMFDLPYRPVSYTHLTLPTIQL